ncbi:NfeD family protein [Fulvimarina sp. 2208YS6-2-32]|uniref:NfeD family protein n=1 Tax=Fulvimarina uroteuthidis TaxID=3098149 RepID=A0ABU5HXL5_9HYPH|nr:NfeD family protein [Fulvimarina sp. 2208YS6-2-32]MDY8107878.1 NfeD family protein [Fulvimarina sp. 2208YS6-2-32]
MFDLFEPEHWWWIAGFALIALELAVPGIYFLFFGLAALIVGTNAFFLPAGLFGVGQQLLAFAAVSAAAIYLGGRWYRASRGTKDDAPENPAHRLVGRETTLSQPIRAGRGRVKLGDSWWTVEGPELPEGTPVRVTGITGSILTVEPTGADPERLGGTAP